ncbi:ATP-binding protein [Actinospongicola halichondriae]|uniref:HAMP domain-containing sensor histidine kinase n=1 Tax=Actinospongicola halichondriae TaxID=3236844 RepID=UPI003D46DB0D
MGGLVAMVSLLVGVSTYYVVRDVLIEERDQSTVDQFTINAALVAAALRTEDIDEVALLSSLRPEVRARELLFADGQWFTSSLQVQPDDLPRTLVRTIDTGSAARQRFRLDDRLFIAIGAPLDGGDQYFEVFSLSDVQSTLATLRNTLIGVGGLATVAGMAIAGLIGRRIAEPLESVSRAAEGIADGDLSTRLDDHADEEVARIAASFNRMADALEERIDRESRFAADVSHELRSPLTTLVNTVSVLENRRGELSDEANEALTLLAGDVKRFERMVADLIEISKHDAGSARVDLEEVVPAQIVTNTLRRLRHESVPIEVADPAVDALVRVDVQRFTVVLRNVLENAVAYGLGPTMVTIDATESEVRVMIDDNGPGVDRHERDRVFERFARGAHGERRSTADGSGLGLSLARENMTGMHGSIHVENVPDGRGARFVLTLPRTAR